MLYTSTLRMVEGLGTGAFSTATLALAADLFPESIGTTMVWENVTITHMQSHIAWESETLYSTIQVDSNSLSEKELASE